MKYFIILIIKNNKIIIKMNKYNTERKFNKINYKIF